jgi:hypothetical protein
VVKEMIPDVSISPHIGEGHRKLFSTTILITHLWSVVFFLREAPALLLRHSIGELVGIAAYYLMFTLIEAVLIWGCLSLMAVMLPRRVLRANLASRGSAVIIATYLWALPLFLNFRLILYTERGRLTWLIGYGLVLTLLCLLFIKYDDLDERISAVVGRFSVLSATYLLLDMVGVVVVLIRNLG